jgi:predicted Zn-dependent peptidase
VRPAALALVALAAGCAARAPAAWVTADQPFRYQRPPLAALDPLTVRGVRTATLPNGLRIIVAEDPTASSVTMRFVNRRGGDDTERDRPGLAALAARTVALVAGRCGAPDDACVNGPTRYAVDHRGAWLLGEVEPGGVGTFIRRVAAGVRAPDLAAGDLDAAANQSIAGARRGGVLASYVAPRVFDDGTLFHSPLAGTAEDIQYLRAPRVREFFARRYAPSECALVAVGRTTLDEVMAYALRLLGPWHATRPPAATAATAALREGGDRVLLLETGSRPQALVLFVVPVRVTGPAALAATHLAGAVLASSFSSRIQRALRMERGSTYSVSSSVVVFGDVALLTIESSIENARVAESLRLVQETVAAVARAGLTDDEHRQARRSIVARWQTTLDSPEGVATLLVDGALAARQDPAAPPPWVAALDALPLAEVNRVLAAEVSVARARVFVRGDASALRAGLEGLGLGPVGTLSAGASGAGEATSE